MNRKDYVELIWSGKEQAIKEAELPTHKKLISCKEESKDFDTTQNLYIEGDNLDALKLLKKEYQNKIKMIYIDPPYNTGNKFIYSDNLSHADWLNMIYPRLKLARDLLTDDGVIFISIDDNEQANLKKVCDEIFGEGNFVANVVWQSTIGSNTGSNTITTVTENIIVYSKTIERVINKEKFVNDGKMQLKDEYFKRRGYYALDKLDSVRQSSHYTESLNYPIKCPDGSLQYPGGENFRKDGWNYLWSKTKIEWGLKNGFIVFKKVSDKWNIYNKRCEFVDNCDQLYDRGLIFRNFVSSSYCTTSTGAKDIENIFDKKVFDYPKPVKLLNKLIYLGTKEDSIILDFFSGSAPTAHAVMKLNAEDGGNRKFIMVQLPEVCAETSEAYKAGYKNICEIGKERIRRAGQKIKDESPLTTQNLDVGFRVLKVDSSNMKDVFYKPNEVTGDIFDNAINNIKEDRTGEDLLFQVLLDMGISLSSKIEKKKIKNKEVFYVYAEDEKFLIASFDRTLNDEVVTEIAKEKPQYFVMRDTDDDKVRINFEQIFKAYSPDTTRKVL